MYTQKTCSVFSAIGVLKAGTKPQLRRSLCTPRTARWNHGWPTTVCLANTGEQGRQQHVLNLFWNCCSSNPTKLSPALLELCYTQESRNGCVTEMLLLGPAWTQTVNSTGFPAQWWSISHDNIPRYGAVMPEDGTQPCGGAILSRDSCSKDGTFLPSAPQLLWLLGWSHRGLKLLLFFLGWILPKETTNGSDEHSPRRGSSTWWWPRTELCLPGVMQSWAGSDAPQNCDS